MSGTVLELFPARGLDQSILVSVLVGIYVLLILTETLGWVWAGLVVPGYLASVFAIEPLSGIAICIEAALTLIACRAISDVLSRAGGWSPFFGRERFFLIVLVSVLVRQACELWLLGDLLDGFSRWTHLAVGDVQLSSIGLVLVPLLANMAWKLTLPRATLQVGVTMAITYAVVAWVLLPFTNLSYASLELTYENVALDFLGSPKAYIILLTSAFVAARFNLAYGWDYNGILVPSLLALTWFEPRLALSTVIESLVLLYASKGVLALPMLKRRNLEGPRKLALVFTVGFVIKLAIGWLLVVWWPLLRLTDLFGFGYVLTSLIAVKMLNLNKTGRVLLPAVAVSFVGFAVGSGVGFGLDKLAPRSRSSLDDVAPATVVDTTRLVRSTLGVAALASARAQAEPPARERPTISAEERGAYAALWRELDAWLSRGDRPGPALRAHVEAAGLRLVELVDDRACWALVERQQGWEAAVLCPGRPGPVIEVVRPRQERAASYAAVAACARTSCAAIVFGQIDPESGDPRALPSTLRAVDGILRARAIVELRAAADVARRAPVLHIRHALPAAVRVPALWPQPVELTWAPPPLANALWDEPSPRVVLRVHPDDLWEVVASSASAVAAEPGLAVFGWVDRLRTSSLVPPPPPSPTELLVLEDQVVGALVEPGAARDHTVIGAVAAALDHELRSLPDGCGPGRAAWVLAGRGHRGWIELAVASDPAEPLVIEVPRPRIEFGTGRIATAVWQASQATALLLDPEWVGARSADYANPAIPGEVGTAFQAAHQALTRAMARTPQSAIVQLRGFAAWREIPDNVVVSIGEPLVDRAAIPPVIDRLLSARSMLGTIANGAPRWVDGAPQVSPLTGAGTPQLLYAQVIGVPFAMVWMSASVRLRVLPPDTREAIRERAALVGIPLVERSLSDALADGLVPGAPTPSEALRRRFAAATARANEYAYTGDLALLTQLARDRSSRVTLGWSPDIRFGFVMIEVRDGATVMRAAALLGATPGPPCVEIEAGAGVDAQVWRAIGVWCPRLQITGLDGGAGRGTR